MSSTLGYRRVLSLLVSVVALVEILQSRQRRSKKKIVCNEQIPSSMLASLLAALSSTMMIEPALGESVRFAGKHLGKYWRLSHAGFVYWSLYVRLRSRLTVGVYQLPHLGRPSFFANLPPSLAILTTPCILQSIYSSYKVGSEVL